ncbi:initiator tRNA phosphoribosyl transferase [Nemania sp. FL0916]|nr:initiator tRNA phosphoribosyl transferase [Nemania sp. FL0916]
MATATATAVESDLQFSPQAHGKNFNRILGDLKRANLSLGNRLRSIRADADFVSSVATSFSGRPVVANERCGSWYVDPALKAASAYFKSTDGHTGQWNFSTRRLNLHLLSLIGKSDGCIVVDSTRRGKAMPDALSKTVPIWCCVLNRVLFPEEEYAQAGAHALYTPPAVVSRSEHAQAEARIADHVEALKGLGVDVDALRSAVKKPLRPLWITPDSGGVNPPPIFDDYHPIICCTSSRRVLGTEMSEGGYIQGAGDDTENWALGLTAALFWEHADKLLPMCEDAYPSLGETIEHLVFEHSMATRVPILPRTPPLEVAQDLFVGQTPVSGPRDPDQAIITIVPKTTEPYTWVQSKRRMEVGIGKHRKLAGRNLRTALGPICDFVDAFLARGLKSPDLSPKPRHILVVCETGKDLSVGVALAIMCRFYDDNGMCIYYLPRGYRGINPADTDTDAGAEVHGNENENVNKALIKRRLSRIMMAFPEANPSRATLQSVNSYLMG